MVKTLELVSEYKYLGILLDERLTFHNHLDTIKKRISQRLYLLKKIRWIIDYKDALLLFKSSILPYFDLEAYSMSAVTMYDLNPCKNCKIIKGLRIILGKKHWIDTDMYLKQIALSIPPMTPC